RPKGVNLSAVSRFAAALAHLCLAERCPSCAGATDRGFCSGCTADLPAIRMPCSACGLPRPVGRCPRIATAWHIDRVVAPFEYAPPIDGFLQALKFGHGRMLGRALALLVAPAVYAHRSGGPTRNDALVTMPLQRPRLAPRGYYQTQVSARS